MYNLLNFMVIFTVYLPVTNGLKKKTGNPQSLPFWYVQHKEETIRMTQVDQSEMALLGPKVPDNDIPLTS